MLEAEQSLHSKAEEDERLAEAKRREEIHRRNLEQYRAAVSRLYEEQPHSYTDMPGFTPGELAERERIIVEEMVRINYSKRYQDNKHEYRHVILPKGIVRWLPSPPRLMTEAEWRSLGVIQSPGWTHYMIHEPEPHVLLFRRDKDS